MVEDAGIDAFDTRDTRDAVAIAIDPWDPLPTFEESRIASGPFTGGYLVAPAGYLNWYFANLGLVAFVDRVPEKVKAYLALYIAHLRPDFSIEDVVFAYPYDPTSTAIPRAQDSDDSYAATFLSLAARYVHVTKDRAWLDANLSTLKAIADRNLIASQESNGLVHVFQDRAKYPYAYTEDNCEVFHGLYDLATLLTEIGDPVAASRYRTAADAIASAISKTMFLPDEGAFGVIFGTTVAPLGTKFYPDAVTQVFPRAHGLPVSAAQDDSAYAFLAKRAPSWWTGSHDKAPFMILGYAAALRGDSTAALAQQAHLRDLVKTDRGSAAIHELGYYQRINDFHRTGVVY